MVEGAIEPSPNRVSRQTTTPRLVSGKTQNPSAVGEVISSNNGGSEQRKEANTGRRTQNYGKTPRKAP